MSCGRSLELDLAQFLRERGSPRWREFELHLGACEDCRQEVDLLAQLGEALGEGAPDPQGHPATEVLARFSEEPGAMLREARRKLILHVVRCGSCRDELAVLQRLDSVLGPARAASEAPAPTGFVARLQRVLRQPAFAYGVALLALVAVVFDRPSEPAPGSLPPPVPGSKGFEPPIDSGVLESLELELSPSARPVLRLGASTDLLLRVPTELATAVVTVRAGEGGLEVRRSLVAQGGFVELDVPSAWLRAGSYEVFVMPEDEDSATRVALGFEIQD